MFVPFDVLEDSARVWIYQSGRKFTETERNTISQTLSSFTQQWAAHGSPLKTSFTILYDQFIVLAVDENFNEASGCSIDSSVHVMQAMDEQYSLGLFDRTRVAFLKNSEVVMMKLSELPGALTENAWRQETLTFNNLITTKGELGTRWVVPAGETWLKRYLTKIAV
jgi:hypothetical protein